MKLPESPQTTKTLQIWFGDLSRSGFDTKYLSLRDELADAAYWGDFDKVFKVLGEAKRACGQSWANVPRLCKQLIFIEAFSSPKWH